MKKILVLPVKLVLSLVFALLIYICTKYEIILTVLTYIIGTLIIDLVFKNKITYNKLKIKLHSDKNGEFFNEEYYDLYWEVNSSRISGFFNSFAFGLAISSFVNSYFTCNFESSIAISTVIIFASIILYTIFIAVSKRENTLMQLFSVRKEKWIGEYTEEENRILDNFSNL